MRLDLLIASVITFRFRFYAFTVFLSTIDYMLTLRNSLRVDGNTIGSERNGKITCDFSFLLAENNSIRTSNCISPCV
jgi:hypothetical protein